MKLKFILRGFIALAALLAGYFLYGITDNSEVPSLAMAVALNELAEKELVKHFRHTGSWLARVPSKNKWVNNDVIKLNQIGADPNVLINNNTYPIPVSPRPDDSTVISLFKYETENTEVTDDELYALPYDKVGSVQEQHRETLEEETEAHALHSLAPLTSSANTPILETSGADDGTGRKRLTRADLIEYDKRLTNAKVPKKGRILVLSSEHKADLLHEDKDLQKQYQNHTEGAIATKYYGFELYESIYSPKYENLTLDKMAFGTADEGRLASVLFHTKSSAKARGTIKRYMRAAKDDPENRKNVIGFRLWFVAIPTREKGQGAILSAKV